MNWKKWTVLSAVVLFVAINFYLIFTSNSEVARTKYIEHWRTVKEQNLIDYKNTDGIVVPAEEEYAYFQSSTGEFSKFLVKEGDIVTPGTPLFEYSPDRIQQVLRQHEAEKAKLEMERNGIQRNIADLEKEERELMKKGDNELMPTEHALSTIRAQLFEKEAQYNRLEGEIEKQDALISISNDNRDRLTLNSTINGVVKEIRHDLQNPVVSITSSQPQVMSILPEDEYFQIEEGMEAIVTSPQLKEKLEGTVLLKKVNPKSEPKVKGDNEYEYYIELLTQTEEEPMLPDEEIEESDELLEDDGAEVLEDDETDIEEEDEAFQLPIGHHVKLKIVMEEAQDALTLPTESIRNGHMYVLRNNGMIEKRKVKTGMKVDGTYEIVSNVKKGEYVLYKPSSIKHKTYFFTPVKLKDVNSKDMKKMGKMQIAKYVSRGLLN